MGKGRIPVAEEATFHTTDSLKGYIKDHDNKDKKWLRLPAYRYTSAEIGKKKKDEQFWEKAYGQLNIKEALIETFKEVDKKDD